MNGLNGYTILSWSIVDSLLYNKCEINSMYNWNIERTVLQSSASSCCCGFNMALATNICYFPPAKLIFYVLGVKNMNYFHSCLLNFKQLCDHTWKLHFIDYVVLICLTDTRQHFIHWRQVKRFSLEGCTKRILRHFIFSLCVRVYIYIHIYIYIYI